jgi:hypothetical protein
VLSCDIGAVNAGTVLLIVLCRLRVTAPITNAWIITNYRKHIELRIIYKSCGFELVLDAFSSADLLALILARLERWNRRPSL